MKLSSSEIQAAESEARSLWQVSAGKISLHRSGQTHCCNSGMVATWPTVHGIGVVAFSTIVPSTFVCGSVGHHHPHVQTPRRPQRTVFTNL